jgi:hypothetical protein
MNKTLLKRIILGAVVLAAAIPGGLVYRQYQHDMALAYQRIASGGQTIRTACGPIQYTEWGAGAPMLIVHGASGGYDQGEYSAELIGGALSLDCAVAVWLPGHARASWCGFSDVGRSLCLSAGCPSILSERIGEYPYFCHFANKAGAISNLK